jgi:predicted nucleotidyltransferase
MDNLTLTIQKHLMQIETEEGVTIFYACESGSRAWGFPSPDSDYDVRFLYVHPLEWYLSIDEKRDVIERPLTENLDLSGWDIRKALRLFRKSNPPLFEWLGSPIIYREKTDLAARLRELAQTSYSPLACIHHYLHMAQGNFREYLKGERVRTKKYFYVLRPILAINWIERGYGVAPTAFGMLLERLVTDPGLQDAIRALILQKTQGSELDHGPRIPVISEFIEKELARLEQGFSAAPNQPPLDEMDRLFRYALEIC